MVDGLKLMLPLKAAIRAASSLRHDIPSLHDSVRVWYSYYKYVEMQSGDAYVLEFLKFCEVFEFNRLAVWSTV